MAGPEPFTIDDPPPQISIESADVTQDQIVVVLTGPPDALGQIRIAVTNSNGQTPVDPINTGTDPVGPGTYTYSFGFDLIPIGEYTTVTAAWTVNGVTTTSTMPYHFKVLGTFRQTQYNTPAENMCSGSPTSVTIYDKSCGLTTGSMLSGFVFRVGNVAGGTGSGHSTSYGDVQVEAYCTSRDPSAFRGHVTIKGTLGSLSDSTVAACPNSQLYQAGVRVFIVGGGVKTVTDRCPACCQDVGLLEYTHLDNFTTNTACSGIGSLPDALTIRLY